MKTTKTQGSMLVSNKENKCYNRNTVRKTIKTQGIYFLNVSFSYYIHYYILLCCIHVASSYGSKSCKVYLWSCGLYFDMYVLCIHVASSSGSKSCKVYLWSSGPCF